jgi:LysR family transcriptional regulator, benzoate and cis,cis-muconate-responsive activator of ben and cat genes
MELRHLRYFIAVAEELNFSRAAERLNVSQPPLSRQIRDLEDELDVQLFERTHQEVKLTTVGRALLIRARELLRDAELLRTRAHQMEGEVYEELQLGYAPSPTAAIIAQILSRYHEMTPGSAVTLHDLSLSEILTGIKAKKLHAGLTLRPRPGEMRGVEFLPLQRYSVGIVCAKSCPLARLNAIRPSSVPTDNLIGYRAAEFPEYHQWVAGVLGVSKARVIISQECDGVLSLIAAVESGTAPAVVAEFITAIAGNRVRFVPFASKPSFTDVGLVYRKRETAENVKKLIASSMAFKEVSRAKSEERSTGAKFCGVKFPSPKRF